VDLMDYHYVKFANNITSPVMIVDYAKSATNVRERYDERSLLLCL
jgi:hypothetical protein